MRKTFNLRKKIASAGPNNIIVIPKILRKELARGTIVEVKIKILEDSEKNEI